MPFAVCARLRRRRRPDGGHEPNRSVAQALGEWPSQVPDDVPPLDWAGAADPAAAGRTVAQPIVGCCSPSGLCAYGTVLVRWHGRTAFLAMVVVGVLAGAASIWLDRRLLGCPAAGDCAAGSPVTRAGRDPPPDLTPRDPGGARRTPPARAPPGSNPPLA